MVYLFIVYNITRKFLCILHSFLIVVYGVSHRMIFKFFAMRLMKNMSFIMHNSVVIYKGNHLSFNILGFSF